MASRCNLLLKSLCLKCCNNWARRSTSDSFAGLVGGTRAGAIDRTLPLVADDADGDAAASLWRSSAGFCLAENG